ncbi:helix-turn-helix transcriptional regulator [Glycomyces salinus]|uniref:helix-turn-helix transcriptional regulator n=1 Tax=Glycomyces salinus TaxID=980294 RepID=UPI0027DA07CC|nr:response regulator transcription factor [Glycomyces salinus]
MLSVLICSSTFAASKRIANDAVRHGVDCAVRTADTGGETLAMLLKRPVEVLVVDAYVALPDDAVFLRRVRRTWPHTAFIVVGAVTSRLTGAAVAAGARGVFGIGPEADELASALVCGPELVPDLLAVAVARTFILIRSEAVRLAAGIPRQATPARADRLTAREIQVLRAMSEGKSNAQIATELFLSVDTVKTHSKRLFRKLGVHDRAHAVAVGFRARLIC